MSILGIDVSKDKLDLCLIINTDKPNKVKNKAIPNNEAGFKEMSAWLKTHTQQSLHICLEATNIYHEKVATYLADAGHIVSVENPAKVKHYAIAMGLRTKNDRVDSRAIALFCLNRQPEPWSPPPAHIRELREMLQQLQDLQDMCYRAANRLDTVRDSTDAKRSIQASIRFYKKQIRDLEAKISKHVDNHPDIKADQDLLTTIKGIGEQTARTILAYLPPVEQLKRAKSAAAYAGLNCCEHRSGKHCGQTKLSKVGNARLRKALYWPAIVAAQYNPVISAFYKRLVANNKRKMSAIGACMRKLLHIAFGVLKTRTPFQAEAS